MNKIIKTTLTTILTLLIIIYTKKYGINELNYFIFLGIYSLYIILNIKDILKKNKINENKNYNILQIIVISIMTIIFIRTLYDTSFIINTSTNINKLKELGNQYLEEASYQTIFYLLQNINYFIGLLVLLLIYRKINMEHKESKYNTITLTTLIISITSIIPSLNCLSGDINPIKYLLFTITLISIETYRLIKDNHKCREWPIYVSWLFNMFAIITIIVDVIKK